jgi:hypothetical protein
MIAEHLHCPPSEQDTWSVTTLESAIGYLEARMHGGGDDG